MQIELLDVSEEDIALIKTWEEQPLIYNFYSSAFVPESNISVDDYSNCKLISIDGVKIGLSIFRKYSDSSLYSLHYIGEVSYRGKGHGKDIIKARIDYAKEHYDFQVMTTFTSEINYPTYKILLDSGFVFTGIRSYESKLMVDSTIQYFDEFQFGYYLKEIPKNISVIHSALLAEIGQHSTEYKARYGHVISKMQV